MKTMLVTTLAALLADALIQPIRRMDTIREFQWIAWGREPVPAYDDVWEVLGELAYDLDFFEPDPARRAESAAYYKEDRVIDEIRSALDTLRTLGSPFPSDLGSAPHNEEA